MSAARDAPGFNSTINWLTASSANAGAIGSMAIKLMHNAVFLNAMVDIFDLLPKRIRRPAVPRRCRSDKSAQCCDGAEARPRGWFRSENILDHRSGPGRGIH